MRMELIQPFINAADAVFAESLQAPTNIVDLSMDENAYRRKGVAALIAIKGDIEGRGAAGRGPGQLPVYALHGPELKPFFTGPDVGNGSVSFSPATSVLVRLRVALL